MLGNEAILILDFGAQYSQLIARRVRDLNVFCEIKSYQISADEIAKKGYKGIIFSGGPNSVYAEKALRCDPDIFSLGIPVLGICYGAQLMAHLLGGTVQQSDAREYPGVFWRAAGKYLLDEPYRLYFESSGRLSSDCSN